MIEAVGLIVLADMQAVEENLAFVHGGIAVLEAHLALPEGFNLGAHQCDSRLVGVDDVIKMLGLAVGGDDTYLLFVLGHRFRIYHCRMCPAREI